MSAIPLSVFDPSPFCAGALDGTRSTGTAERVAEQTKAAA